MGSITCAECNQSFDVPRHLTSEAMALHQRTLHAQIPPPCEHLWEPPEFFGQTAAEVRCQLCERGKLIINPFESWR